ncbi:daptide-type RiPP [Paenibacillus pini]|nr:daptide-type RiPP [Paenibacillus pini]
MMMEELERVEAPSDATFWGGAAIGTVAVVGVGLLFCS